MNHLLLGLLKHSDINQNAQIINEIYTFKYESSSEKHCIHLIMHKRQRVDFCGIFDHDVMCFLSKCNNFIITIETQIEHNAYDERKDCFEKKLTLQKSYQIEKISIDCSIYLNIQSENKDLQHPILNLFNFHLTKCLSSFYIEVSLESQDLWVRKLVYQLFMKQRIRCFDCHNIKISREKNHHHLMVSRTGDLSYLDKDVIYKVSYIRNISKEQQDMFNCTTNQISKLKVFSLRVKKPFDFYLEHPEYLKKMEFRKLFLGRLDMDCLKRNIMFVDYLNIGKIKIPSRAEIERHVHEELVSWFFDVISTSFIRKLNIENINALDISSNNFEKLNRMRNITSFEFSGRMVDMDESLVRFSMCHPRLQIFETDYVFPDCHESLKYFQTRKQNNMFRLKMNIGENYFITNRCERLVQKFPNLTNLRLMFHRRATTKRLCQILLSTHNNKLNQIDCWTPEGEDKSLKRISKFNNFKRKIDRHMSDVFMSYCHGVCPKKLLSKQSKEFTDYFFKTQSQFFGHFNCETKTTKKIWHYLMSHMLKFHGSMYDDVENKKYTVVIDKRIDEDFMILCFEMILPEDSTREYKIHMKKRAIIKL